MTCANCIEEVATLPTRWCGKDIGLCRRCRKALADTGMLPTVRTRGEVSTSRSTYHPTLDELDKWSPR